MQAIFVVVGGGIAGVSCAETLAILQPESSIILLSESSLIKTVTNLYAVTRTLSHFDVEEKNFKVLTDKYRNITVIHKKLVEIKSKHSQIITDGGQSIKYKFLCLCSGATPKLIPSADQYPEHILGIRDTDSVETFTKKLCLSKS